MSNIIAQDDRIMSERREKLTTLRSLINPYPNQLDYTKLANIDLSQIDESQVFSLAGRIMSLREMGKSTFFDLHDADKKIQCYLGKNSLTEEQLTQFKLLDLGDIVNLTGSLFITKSGEVTLRVVTLKVLAKAIRPIPTKLLGELDIEIKYRQRYLDLIVDNTAKNILINRSHIVQNIRTTMMQLGYLEVETPMLHPIPGGANAKPFVTHHNALDMDMYLRIAPELYLKRLIVGGLNQVFEINRNFRNEGVSARHNPEFTMLEFYQAYANYIIMMDQTETIIRNASIAIHGTANITYNGKNVDLSKPFDRLTIIEAILKYNPHYTQEQLNDILFLKEEIVKLGEKLPHDSNDLGTLQLSMFEASTETQLWRPTFVIDYPVSTSPLARESDTQPGITERFELFIVGREHANGYSELNDPEDQAQRFKSQVIQKDGGNDEAMYFDSDYIRALEYGMPPTGGCGIGIDRLVMLLTDSQSIRDVIYFPHMRPE